MTDDPKFVSDTDPRRWGFIDDDGVFVAIPKPPLGGLTPPVTVQTYFGPRTVIVEPACPMCLAELAPDAVCERCADDGEAHEPIGEGDVA